MFAFGGVTIVQKFTHAIEACKNMALLPPGKLLYDGDAPKCKHFWQFLAQCHILTLKLGVFSRVGIWPNFVDKDKFMRSDSLSFSWRWNCALADKALWYALST